MKRKDAQEQQKQEKKKQALDLKTAQQQQRKEQLAAKAEKRKQEKAKMKVIRKEMHDQRKLQEETAMKLKKQHQELVTKQQQFNDSVSKQLLSIQNKIKMQQQQDEIHETQQHAKTAADTENKTTPAVQRKPKRKRNEKNAVDVDGAQNNNNKPVTKTNKRKKAKPIRDVTTDANSSDSGTTDVSSGMPGFIPTSTIAIPIAIPTTFEFSSPGKDVGTLETTENTENINKPIQETKDEYTVKKSITLDKGLIPSVNDTGITDEKSKIKDISPLLHSIFVEPKPTNTNAEYETSTSTSTTTTATTAAIASGDDSTKTNATMTDTVVERKKRGRKLGSKNKPKIGKTGQIYNASKLDTILENDNEPTETSMESLKRYDFTLDSLIPSI